MARFQLRSRPHPISSAFYQYRTFSILHRAARLLIHPSGYMLVLVGS